MQKSLFATTASVIAIGLAAATTPVFAQGTTSSGSSNAQSGYSQSGSSAGNISQSEVQKFAKAQNDMQSLVRDQQQKINNANGDKAKQYRQQMNKKIIKTIKKDGLSVKQYNQIAQASRNDQQLQQRIQKAMQD